MTKRDFLQNSGTTRSSVIRRQERVECDTEKAFFVLSFDTKKQYYRKIWLGCKQSLWNCLTDYQITKALQHVMQTNKGMWKLEFSHGRVFGLCIFGPCLLIHAKTDEPLAEVWRISCDLVMSRSVLTSGDFQYCMLSVKRTRMNHNRIPPSNASRLMHKQLFGIHSKQCSSRY